MDNHSKKDISIRINGKEKFNEDNTEQVEIESDLKMNTENDDEEEFPWILVDEPVKDKVIDFEENRKKRRNDPKAPNKGLPKFKRNMSFRIPKVWISLVSAIVIGTSFGVVVLSLFTDQDLVDLLKTSQPVTTIEQQEEVSNTNGPKEEDIVPVQASSEAETVALLEPLSVFVIQGGAFSTLESANQYEQSLQDKGYASIVLNDANPFYLFIGIGLSQGRASQVGDLYKDNGQEVYVKSYSIGEKKVSSEVASYLKEATNLFNHLVAHSSASLSNTSSASDRWNDISKVKSNWEEKNMDESKLPSGAQSFVNEINAAYGFLEVYQNTNQSSLLWDAQQALLNAVSAYQELPSS